MSGGVAVVAGAAALQDPSRFFTELGEQIQTQMEEVTHRIAGDDPPGESYLEKVNRLRLARSQAEEIVVADLTTITANRSRRPTSGHWSTTS